MAFLAAGVITGIPFLLAAQVPGVEVSLEDYEGPARIRSGLVEKHKLRIDVDPGTETNELEIRVDLPTTGRDAWPVADVEVRDERGEAVAVRRGGIEWERMRIPVPARRATYFVQAVEPARPVPARRADAERRIEDPDSGISVSVARWPDGRKAALSLRFDDSHPTHLEVAVPILDEYGFRGTFMVNPGEDEPGSRRRSAFQARRAEWEWIAGAGRHELANHSSHHRGAKDDADMEAEVGEAAGVIRELTGEEGLIALNLGGGTQWTTSRTLRHYLDRHRLFDASSGSMGMDDSYGNRVAAFREHLERHLEREGWCRAHFHAIGEGLGSSEANFRAALDVAKEHEGDLWIAGMAEIHRYEVARDAAMLRQVATGEGPVGFRLLCPTDPKLYDRELTLEIRLPERVSAGTVRVRDGGGIVVATREAKGEPGAVLRIRVDPVIAEYAVEWQ